MRNWLNIFESEHPWEKWVWQVRCHYAPNFQGQCEAASVDLADILKAHNIPCRIIQGSYDHPYDDGEVQCDTSSHVWVEIDGYILDPTAEQFDTDQTIVPLGSEDAQRYDGHEEMLDEAYLGTYNVECDYGGRNQQEVFTNPSKLEFGRILGQSEYASVRACLYPDTGDLYIWDGSRVQHHDMHHALFGHSRREYIRLFFDRSGISMTHLDEDADEENTAIVKSSPVIQRLFGREPEVHIE